MHKTNTQRGFTIVELLIVIVIIGILATLVVTTFRGIQERARNTQRVTAAKAYDGIIRNYMIFNGEYPMTTNASACLGDTNPGGRCGTNNSRPERDALNANLRTVSKNLPDISDAPARGDDGELHTGAVLSYASNRTVNGNERPWLIGYYLEGADQNCNMNGITRNDPGGGNNALITGNFKNSRTEGNSTACYISIPRPDEL